ncbi:DNA-directed RNA polymerase subunit A' [Halalkaliarchaeum sp. AArc-CO]|nr:DNA-directed RNA polymerase subunit A' [Halalkaliarchaeum sp. AArc-CO]
MAMQSPKTIGGISFGLMDPETYRDMSATKVITADTYDDDGYPIDMGLMDPRLGVIDPGLECRTCGKHSGSCNGHFGHIELAAPVIHVGFAKLIRRLLRSTCRECGRLALMPDEMEEFREKLERTRELGNDPNDVLKAAVRQARKASRCPHCGSPQADIKHEKPTTYYEVQDVLAGNYSERIADAMQPDPDDEDDRGISPQELAEETDIALERVNQILSGEFRPRKEDRRSLEKELDVDLTEEDMNKLMPSDIRDWFEDIPDEDLRVLGINAENSRPEWMILTVLPVPPVTARPSITLDNGQRSEDDLTHKLVDIIRINQRFMENREAGAPQLIIEDLWELLQYHVTTFIDNEISGTPPARHRSGRPLKTLSQRLKGKEGRFRGSLSGKRVNFSARTVISPDPTLSLNEVGVPDRVAKEMTQTMNVTERNLDRARQYVRNGPEDHPGANYVRRPDGRRLKVTEKNCEELADKVEVDWEVNRHLVDGDIVIFNRQPSLHRMSIMAHEVVVMPYKTFRLNTTVCVAGDTRVDCGGYERRIENLENDWNEEVVSTYDPGDGELRGTGLQDFWSLRPSDYGASVNRIETASGGEIVATSDHPLQTPDGLVRVEELSEGDRLVRRPIDLPEFEPDAREQTAITEGDIRAAAPPETYLEYTLENLEGLLPFDVHSRNGVAAARLIGHLFGDGTLELDGHRARLIFRAPREELGEIRMDLERLGFEPEDPRYKENEAQIVAADGSTVDVSGGGYAMELRSKPLATFMAALGVPAGDKTTAEFTVPDWVMTGPKAVKRNFLSAYFGAELSTPAPRGSKLFKQPVFKVAKTDDVFDSGRRFIGDVNELLEEFGTRISNVREDDGNRRVDGSISTTLSAELDAGQEALRNLFGRIGYTYNRAADAEARFAYAYLSEKIDELDRLARIATAARTANGEYGELTELAEEHDVDPKRVRRWRQRDIVQPRANDFPGYDVWKSDRVVDESEGLIREPISAIEEVPEERVYDVTTVDDAHRFITNEFVGSNCPPYNADFDGDEMNMHALQNEEARAEARVLMRVQEQILSPRFGENIIGAIQDHISGMYLLTHEDPEFTETQALDLLRATRIDDLPEPDGENEQGSYWTGRSIFSLLLPDDLTMEFTSEAGDTVVIENGELLEGTIDSEGVGEFGGEIVDTITKVYGETRARVFVNEVAALAMRAIMHFGFSIGIDDESIPQQAEEQVNEAIQSAYDRVEELIETYQVGELESLPGRTVDETLEMKIMQTLGKARDSAGDIAEQHFTEDNPAVVMAQSGARGSMLNLTQMAGCVGQQAVRGERINRGYEDRTLSHFEPNDLSADAHGFVENSYRGGLTPKEFFFHAMGGREGLVDTAVRTSKSGYLQRRLINALSELEAQYDGTVRDTSDTIVQFEFGEDGTSPVRVSSSEDNDIDVDQIADRVLEAEFDSEEEREEFLGRREPPTNLSEYAGPGLDKAQGLDTEVESDD